ncbi:TlpA disulfide reductase family protein [Plantactinospora sp. B6F1]|uniref:TlpA disulfide reductase family protein n=1 Tax=Plantactinospora sp. B6F1 TaxID=3158971 RepID=UPI00102D172C
MSYLVVATVLLGLLAGANLIFTYGVVRRLREHTARLDAMAGGGRPEPELILSAGAEPRPFAPVTTSVGVPIGPDDLTAGGTLVGFFSPNCAPCREQAPRFVERAAASGSDRVLAVAVGTPEATRELVALLEPVARVVVEIEDGPLHQAFAVQGYPAMCVLDGDGRVKASATAVERLPELPAT